MARPMVRIISNRIRAIFAGSGGQDYSLPVFDYGETYCIEIPLLVLTEKSSYKFNKVMVTLP